MLLKLMSKKIINNNNKFPRILLIRILFNIFLPILEEKVVIVPNVEFKQKIKWKIAFLWRMMILCKKKRNICSKIVLINKKLNIIIKLSIVIIKKVTII